MYNIFYFVNTQKNCMQVCKYATLHASTETKLNIEIRKNVCIFARSLIKVWPLMSNS